MENTYKLVELFSGIGSQAKALKNLGIKVNLQGTCEWDVHAIAAYDVIHNSPEIPDEILKMEKKELLEILGNYTFSNSGKEPLSSASLRTYSTDALQRIYTSIQRNKNFVDVTKLDGKKLPEDIDILTYSFPCQDLSNVGAFHGYNKGIDKDSGSRSSLLWQVGRILTEMKGSSKSLPRFLLMENVPTLLSKRHFSNFETWISDLEELGYVSQYYQLNASSFGVPQNRPRLLMISVYVGDDAETGQLIRSYFKWKNKPDDIVADYRESHYYTQYTVKQLLRTNYSDKTILNEAVECTPNDTKSRRKIWDENPQIILPDGTFNPAINFVRTITTKQDRNPNSGNLYFDSKIDGRSTFRYLTPRECLLFMGFTDKDFMKLKNNNVEFHKGDFLFSRDKVIRMAGNSIPVKLLEGIFYQIMKIDALLKSYNERKTLRLDNIRRADMIKIIRSELFRRKIRCRQGNIVGPDGADIVYPKYNTAIYIADCFDYGHNCSKQMEDDINHDYWKLQIAERRHILEKKIAVAEETGWKTMIVWCCELTGGMAFDVISRIEKALKNNLSSGRHKETDNG